MSAELSRAEGHVVEHLAANTDRRLKWEEGTGHYTIEEVGGGRVGHRLQRRTIAKLEVKGFIRYAEGFYILTVAGKEALK